MNNIGKVIEAMIDYSKDDVRRISHFLKVYGFAKAIGENEGLDEATQSILEIAALTHDIGIKKSEEKYKSAAGNYQQIEGPPEAQKMLEILCFNQNLIDRVCWLIAHHHTYTDIIGSDYQILVEADFLVNADEDSLSQVSIKSVCEKVFKTKTGKEFLRKMYNY